MVKLTQCTPAKTLLILFLVSAAIHAVYLIQLSDHPAFLKPLNDSRLYHVMAVQIAASEFHSADPYFQAPFFPYVLALIYGVFGPNVLAARVILCLLGSATPVFVYLLARAMAGSRAAIIAGAMAACWGPLIFFNAELLPAGLATMIGAAFLVVMMHALHTRSLGFWLASGALAGLAAITVTSFLLVCVLVPAWLLVTAVRSREWKQVMPPVCVFLLGASACIAPVTARNWNASGQPVLIACNGGINLYLSNNEQSMKTMAIRPGPEWDYLERSAVRAGAQNASDADRYFMRETALYVMRHPGHFVTTLAYKIRLLCHARELPRTVDPYDARAYSSLLSVLMWDLGAFAFPWGLAFPLMIPGLVICVRSSRDNRLPVTCFLVYGASVAAFFVSSRHRLPMVPMLIVLAAVGGVWLWDTRGQWKSHLGLLLPTVAVAGWINLPVSAPTDHINLRAETHLLLGILAAEEGDTSEEEAQYQRAVDLAPEYAEAYAQWGTRMVSQNRINEGIELLLKAIELDPGRAEARNNLGLAFERAGMKEAAIQQYQQALEMRPYLSRTHANIGRLMLEQGDARAAVAAYFESVRSDPLNAESPRIRLRPSATVPRPCASPRLRCADQAEPGRAISTRSRRHTLRPAASSRPLQRRAGLSGWGRPRETMPGRHVPPSASWRIRTNVHIGTSPWRGPQTVHETQTPQRGLLGLHLRRAPERGLFVPLSGHPRWPPERGVDRHRHASSRPPPVLRIPA